MTRRIELIIVSKETSEALNKLRVKMESENWDQFTNEKATRRMLSKSKTMSEDLIDANIFAIPHAREIKNDKVLSMPILGKDGSIHCVVCNGFPVVCAVIIPSMTNKVPMTDNINDDVTFISFVCNKHAIDPDLTQKEIEDKNVWLRLLHLGDSYLKEESEL